MLNNRKINIILILIVLTGIVYIFLNIHPFLASSKPVDADVLIVEGWIAGTDRALEEVVEEFSRRNYKFIITVGEAVNRPGESGNSNYAAIAAKGLVALGFDKALIYEVPVPPVQKHNNFSMALASRIWLENKGIQVKGVNVFTFGAHARKSEAVFKQVFEPDIKAGVISATPLHYNPKYWWLSKRAWKWVFYDFIKYVCT